MKCLGCDAEYNFQGEFICFTCPCGATMFYESHDRAMLIPTSFWMSLHDEKEFPHIDYYVGKSDHMNERKDHMIRYLQEKGAIWSWECDKCKEKVLKMTKYRVDEKIYRFGIHPELQQLISQETISHEKVS